jgi:cystathionine gamma-synthase
MRDGSRSNRSPETIAASYGVASDVAYGAISPPIYLSSTFEFEQFEIPRPYDYGRVGNPSRDLLGETLARLEGGAGSVITSSGMSAVDLLLGQMKPGGHVIAPHDCYGGTMRLLKARSARCGFAVDFVDQSNDVDLYSALKSETSLILVESPSNPLMRVVDIAKVVELARTVEAAVAVDNTFLSPALQQPLALGADYVIHSTTKFLNGHSDVIGGAVVAANADRALELRAWLTLRGMRTLFPRMERQQRTAMQLANWLLEHSAVKGVNYPGLPSNPYHALAARQQKGFGAMLSFELADGVEAVKAFLDRLQIFTLAESLGGIESLVSHPATMTHVDMGEDARRSVGISNSLVRLSVGLEDAEELVADLADGLREL